MTPTVKFYGRDARLDEDTHQALLCFLHQRVAGLPRECAPRLLVDSIAIELNHLREKTAFIETHADPYTQRS